MSQYRLNEQAKKLVEKAYTNYRLKAIELITNHNTDKFSQKEIYFILDKKLGEGVEEILSGVIQLYEKQSRRMMSCEEKENFKKEIRDCLSSLEMNLRMDGK